MGRTGRLAVAWWLGLLGAVGCAQVPPERPAQPHPSAAPQPPDAGTPPALPAPDAGTPPPTGGGVAGCTPMAGICFRASCGPHPDGCGGTVDCGGCLQGEVCGGDGMEGVCGTPVALSSCVGVQDREAFPPLTGGVEGLRECVADGWCTDNAHLDMNPKLWGFTEQDVWAVGGRDRAIALHWDGARWRRVPTPPAGGLRGVWGAGPRDVWAVGERGTVLRWDGTAWRPLATPTDERLTDVHGTGPADVWLVGPRVALHWDGTRLSETAGWTSPEDAADAASVWAAAPGAVFAGNALGCQRWDGQRWSATPCGVKGVTDIWASGPDDVWVVGTWQRSMSVDTYRAHWDGRAWKTDASNDWENVRYEAWRSVFGFGPREVWVNGTWRFDGERWTRLCKGTARSSLWGAPSGVLLGAGADGLARFDGQAWRYTATLALSSAGFVANAQGSRLLLDGRGALGVHDGTGWTSRYTAPPPGGGLGYNAQTAKLGTGPDDLWVVAFWNALLRWDGQAWSRPQGDFRVTAAWEPRPGELLAARVAHASQGGRPQLARWDGAAWQPLGVELGDDWLTGMWGSGPDDVWAVGRAGGEYGNGTSVAWHWDGRQWARTAHPAMWLFGVFGVGGRVWTLELQAGPGNPVAVSEWDGARFAPQLTLPDGDRGYETQLAGAAPDDLWLTAGAHPAGTRMFQFDGATWHERAPLPGWILSLQAVPGVATYALDAYGVLYERRH